MKILINEINVGERRRENMGDIRGLADSIAKYGLLHPVVIDENNNLVAGGRRLEACKLLGWHEIEVTPLGELSEKELRAIELEENLQRQDLTELEKSRNMIELVAVVEEQIKEEFRATVARNSEPTGGRPKEPGSYRDIEHRTGIPQATIRVAEKHVHAVNEFPELEELPKMQAIETAKKLNSLPAEERKPVIDAIKQSTQSEPAPETPEEEERRKAFNKARQFRKNVDSLISRLSAYACDKHDPDYYFEGLDEIEMAFGKITLFAEAELHTIESGIRWLQKFRDEYAKRMFAPQGIRRVK